MRTALTLSFWFLLGAASLGAQAALEPLPILVRPAAKTSFPALQTEAAARLTRVLLEAGRPVVAPSWARGAAALPPRRAAAATGAGWVLRVEVQPLRERRQQGRYRVEDRVILELLDPETGRLLWAGTRTAAGTAFAGFRAAHGAALAGLLATGGEGLVPGLLAALGRVDREEKAAGRLLFLDIEAPGAAARALAAAVRGTPGVVAASVRTAGIASGGGKIHLRLRYRGSAFALAEALLLHLPTDAAVEAAVGPRRIRLGVASRPSAASRPPKTVLLDALSGLVRRLTEDLAALLRGREVAVETPVARGLAPAVRARVGEHLKRTGALPRPAGAAPLRLTAAVRPREDRLALAVTVRGAAPVQTRRLLLPAGVSRRLRALLER